MTASFVDELRAELSDMKDRSPRLQDPDLFVAWFLKAFLTGNEQNALLALVGATNDKGIDAIFIDDQAKTVFIIQGKYRQRVNVARENHNDVVSFAEISKVFSDPDAYDIFTKGLDASVNEKVNAAKRYIGKQGYRLHMYYVTTGTCSADLAREGARISRQGPRSTLFEVFGGNRVTRLMEDYLIVGVPPIPQVELKIEGGRGGVTLGGILQRNDDGTGIETFVFPVNVFEVAELYQRWGDRIFARNVRGFMGKNAINDGMENSLDKEPQNFWYYNNGLTIVCDGAEHANSNGQQFMRIENPQVINGQQTARTLHKKAKENSRASVMVRVIRIPRADSRTSDQFDKIISKIVAATNWQNAIFASDLKANDRVQVDLERNLRKVGYLYLRKRQLKSEAKRVAGSTHQFIVTKEEFAQTVAACDLDPLLPRLGKEGLFEEPNYGRIFKNSSPIYYLVRYWLAKNVTHSAIGFPEWSYAKWLVMHHLWHSLSGLLNTNIKKEIFYKSCEQKRFLKFKAVIDSTYSATSSFFKASRGSGKAATDVSNFFKHKGLPKNFEDFLNSAKGSRYQTSFEKKWSIFVKEFDAQLHSSK